MKYKVILFDCDGLVLNSERFSTCLEKDYGITWEIMKPFFDGPFVQCKLGKSDLRTELQKVILTWKWPGTVDELLNYWHNIRITVNQEIIALVRYIHEKGVACYLASNQTADRMEYLRKDFGLSDVFNGFYISATLGHLKDEAVFFEKILEDQIKASPISSRAVISSKEILFVDPEEKNLNAAKTVGIATHMYTDIDSLKKYILE